MNVVLFFIMCLVNKWEDSQLIDLEGVVNSIGLWQVQYGGL